MPRSQWLSSDPQKTGVGSPILHENLIEAGKFISIVEKRQGLKVACLEEISYKNGWIDKKIIQKTISKLGNNEYGNYLKSLIQK